MLREELLKKIRHIEFATRKIVDDVMAGQYRTHFKGQGMQFSEHRVYLPGDDVRHIDWKASARTREPLIKKFEEERELTVLLVIDLSASEDFGSIKRVKAEVVAELAAMLSYAAIHTGDKVGAILFADGIEKTLKPQKGKAHVLRLIREILTFRPKTRGTNLKLALETAEQVMKHAGVVFVLSDFLDEGFESPLKRLCARNDVVCISIEDELETGWPALGLIRFFDPERGQEGVVDTSSYAFRKWMEGYGKEREGSLAKLSKGSGAEWLRIKTKEDYADALVQFFIRNRR